MGMSSLWRKLSRNPESALARARQRLDKALPAKAASFRIDEKAWACYELALVAATKSGGNAVTSLVLEFDPRFPSGPAPAALRYGGDPYLRGDPYLIGIISHVSSLETRPLHKAITILLANQPVPDPMLEAAHRLAIRQDDIAQIRRMEHLICLSLAIRGDSDRLISKLRDRRKRGLLARPEIEEAVSAYLSAHRFDIASPWAGFFDQLRQDELPRIHEVHQLLGQLRDAADAALRYLLQRPETEAAPRAVALSEGQDQVLREFVQKGAWLEAIRLVRGTAESLRGKERVAKLLRAEDNEEYIRSEVARLSSILGSLVRIARASLREESRNAGPGAEVFRRWSAIEEAAGNFLGAGLQAELGQDYVTAALMFEKAGAFEQTRRAFDRSPRSDLERRAELLERGGDFSAAARLYERLGQTEKVLEMYEQEGFGVFTTDLHL